jgi:antitoxin (DNA-binding transcriptional repressor) of toxin-antitoxin stability system
MKQEVTTQDTAAALLRVAAYLGRPQKFMPLRDARAEMRRALELAAKGSVVLTSHGEPAAAVVAFTTLEDMRRAVLHLLVDEMGATFERSRERARSQRRDVPATNEEELETLVGEAVRNARKRNGKASRKIPRN